jgi:photosystem II stability/assembly factor-like uncharacterized protein
MSSITQSIVNSNIAWVIVGNSSTSTSPNLVYRTTDGGLNWSLKTTIGVAGFSNNSITAIDSMNAWVSQYDYSNSTGSRIYKTSDGGVTWNYQNTASYNGIGSFANKVHFFNLQDGIVVGDNYGACFEIYKTSNGGALWTRVNCNNIQLINNDLSFSNENSFTNFGNSIWFTTQNGSIYNSTNKGLNWTGYATPLKSIQNLVFKSTFNGFISGYDLNGKYLLYSTNDGGATWEEIKYTGLIMGDKLTYEPVNNILFSNGVSSTGYKGISFSKNNGISWSNIANPDSFNINKLSFLSGNKALITGRKANNIGELFTLDINTSTISANNSTSFCLGDSVLIIATPVNGYNYQWQTNGNDIFNATSLNTTIKNSGTYRMRLSKIAACPFFTNSINVINNPKPIANFTVNSLEQCLKSNNFIFNDVSTISAGTLNRLWNFGDTTLSFTDSSTSKIYKSANTFNVKLVSSSSNGCKDSITKIIKVNSNPASNLISGSINPIINTTQTYSTINISGITYNWIASNGNILSGNGTNSINVNWSKIGSGSLKVVQTNIFGCLSDTTELLVNIIENIISENWITISNDAIDDHKNKTRLDGTKLEYAYNMTTDTISFRFTTNTISSIQSADFGLNVMVNISNAGVDTFNFWGDDNKKAYHKLLSVWVTGTAPSNYTGTIGIADANGVKTDQYSNKFNNNIAINLNQSASNIIIKLKRKDLLPDIHFIGDSIKVLTAGAVGASNGWNDDIYAANGFMSFKKSKSSSVYDKVVEHSKINVYPNPANDYIIFDGKDLNKSSIIVYDIQGKEIIDLKHVGSNNLYYLNTIQLNNGIYFYTILNSDGNIQKGKFVIIN